jgi:hypothetical protein
LVLSFIQLQAIAAYRQALQGVDLEPERRFLEGRLAELQNGG